MRTLIRTALIASAIITTALPAFANDGAIAHRKAIFQAVGGHMKAMVSVLKGHVPHKESLSSHARSIAALSQIVEKAFPSDSDFGETRAKEIIWENQADFKMKIDAFQSAAAALAKTDNKDMGAFAEAVGALGKTCKSCHDKYRDEK